MKDYNKKRKPENELKNKEKRNEKRREDRKFWVLFNLCYDCRCSKI